MDQEICGSGFPAAIGFKIGPHLVYIILEDVLIAASVITHQFVVVTANDRHFPRVAGLPVENWLEKK